MKDRGESGKKLANQAGFLLVAGCVFLGFALCVGMVGIGGTLARIANVASAIMVTLIVLGIAFLAAGLNRRRAARIAGWSPKHETVQQTEASIGSRNNANGALASAAIAEPEEDEAGVLPAQTRPTTASAGDAGSTPDESPSESMSADAGQEHPITPLDTGKGFPSEYLPGEFDSFASPSDDGRALSIPHQVAKERMATVERMLLRSEDIFASVKDLAASGRTVDAFADLSTMLAASDALKLTDPPKIKPIKLTRNDRYWLGSDVMEATDEIFDAVVSLEAAFNICHDIIALQGAHPEETTKRDTFGNVRHVLASTSKVKPNYATRSDALALAYPDWSEAQPLGEWEMQMNIANAAENAGLPFRIVFDMKVNAIEKLVLVRMQVPRPSCFSIAGADEGQREALARDYAFRSALFMAKAALNAPDKNRAADLAVVTCYPRSGAEAVLSLEATRDSLPLLNSIARHEAPIQEFSHADVRMCWDNDWLDPIDPHLEADDPLFFPERYSEAVESSRKSCSERLAQATGAHLECDLGIVEGVAKQQAWMLLEGKLSSLEPTVKNAVAATKDLQDSTDDPAIYDACGRIMRALVNGTIEPDQTDQLGALFKGDDALVEALTAGAMAFASHQPSDLERAIGQLTQALSPTMQIELMDDTESVFRHFRNTAERISYNLHHSDERQVRLAPRAYYAANEMAAHILCLLERPEEAEPYVDEVVRLAPLSASAVVTKARVLEDMSRLFEAIDLVNAAILDAPTVRDAALCYYRMAYLQWRTGRHDVAAAAYRASIALRTEIAPQAQSELNDLFETDSEQQDYSVEEAFTIMEDGGVNIWPREQRREEIAKAAVLCTDNHLYPAAKQLGMALLEFRHDDALIDICRSLSSE